MNEGRIRDLQFRLDRMTAWTPENVQRGFTAGMAATAIELGARKWWEASRGWL